MFGIDSTVFYENENFEKVMSNNDFEFYKEQFEELKKYLHDISIVWIVPDDYEGHLEAKCFETWEDAKIWIGQR